LLLADQPVGLALVPEAGHVALCVDCATERDCRHCRHGECRQRLVRMCNDERYSPVLTGTHRYSPVLTGTHRYSPVLNGTHRYSTVGSPVRTGGDEHGSALVGQSGQPVQHDATATCAQRSAAHSGCAAQRSTVKRSACLRRTSGADRSVTDCDSLTVALPTAKPTRSVYCGYCCGERAKSLTAAAAERHSRTHCGTPRYAVNTLSAAARTAQPCRLPPTLHVFLSRTAQHSAHCWASLRRVRVVGL
jgi:hypothetical protein